MVYQHGLSKKREQSEEFALTSSPLCIQSSATINSGTVNSINSATLCGKSIAIPFSSLLDNYSAVQDRIVNVIKYYQMPIGDDYSLKFALHGLTVKNFRTPRTNDGSCIAGSLIMPHIQSMTTPIDDLVGENSEWRKVIDLERPMVFCMGQHHSFSHALKHDSMDYEYKLLHEGSNTIPPVIFPGTREPLIDATPMLYGASIARNTFFEDPKWQVPGLLKHMIASDNYLSMQPKYNVVLQDSMYPASWFPGTKSFRSEHGVEVPIEDYSSSAYRFMCRMYNRRVTNFLNSGMCFAGSFDREVPLRFDIEFTLRPIVPSYENAMYIPHQNFMDHLQSVLPLMKKGN